MLKFLGVSECPASPSLVQLCQVHSSVGGLRRSAQWSLGRPRLRRFSQHWLLYFRFVSLCFSFVRLHLHAKIRLWLTSTILAWLIQAFAWHPSWYDFRWGKKFRNQPTEKVPNNFYKSSKLSI